MNQFLNSSSYFCFDGTKWTPEENKQFEDALALFDKETPDRWHNVARLIPGKSVSDVIYQYRKLEEDISDIEAGVPDDPVTLEWVANNHSPCSYQSHGGAKRCQSNRFNDHEKKKGIPWTEEEHRQFLLGLKKYGKGDWRNISRNFVTSRTPTQVASHAQKYFIRQLSVGKDKRRSSIHDITTVHLTHTAQKYQYPELKPKPKPKQKPSECTVAPHHYMAKLSMYQWSHTDQQVTTSLSLHGIRSSSYGTVFQETYRIVEQ